MEGLWYKEVEQGRRFVIKIAPGESLRRRLIEFAQAALVKHAVLVSAVGSVQDVHFRGIKTGARLPITPPRIHLHEVQGPLELLALTGNLFPDEQGATDCHLHVMGGKSSGEVLGGHLLDARVFATCEIVLTEILAEGLERHHSRTGGVDTLYIDAP
ncbi:MAG TPA: PPC domain-containing DNA-binding protein [Anaeromyxobacteraceae bacterium]|nr:PPC domain-containing DNA-binding protein [Anaeromyxobacteraceae bacterium]